jgi:hypothetical protein
MICTFCKNHAKISLKFELIARCCRPRWSSWWVLAPEDFPHHGLSLWHVPVLNSLSRPCIPYWQGPTNLSAPGREIHPRQKLHPEHELLAGSNPWRTGPCRHWRSRHQDSLNAVVPAGHPPPFDMYCTIQIRSVSSRKVLAYRILPYVLFLPRSSENDQSDRLNFVLAHVKTLKIRK